MANYSLTVTPKFTPLSFDQLIQPLMLYAQAYREQENAYTDMVTKSSVWDRILNKERDKLSYEAYEKYAQDLQEAADNLATQGLSVNSRQSMLNLRKRYAQDITPIENAYKLRAEDIKRQQDIYDKTGGRTLFTRRALDTSIDDYINGNPLDYGTVNLDTVLNMGVAGGKAISSRYIKTKEGKRFNGDYLSLITETGLTPEEAMQVMTENSDKYPEFQKFINDTLTSTGYDNFDVANQAIIKSSLLQGINAGIVHSQAENLNQNWRAQANLQFSLQEQANQNEHTRKMEEILAKAGLNGSTLFNPKVPSGVEGEKDTDLDRLKGLKATVDEDEDAKGKKKGKKDVKKDAKKKIVASTSRLDNLKQKIADADKAIQAFKEKMGTTAIKEIASYNPAPAIPQRYPNNAYANLGRQMYGNNNAPRGYKEYNKLITAKQAAEREYNEEKKYLSDLAKKNSAYGNNQYEILSRVYAIKQSQLGQQSYFQGLNLNDASYKNVTNALTRLVGPGLKLIDGNKAISKEKAQEKLADANTSIGIKVTRNGVYLAAVDGDGNTYKISGARHIDAFNNKVTEINKALSDFGSRAKGNIAVAHTNIHGIPDPEKMFKQGVTQGKSLTYRGVPLRKVTVYVPELNDYCNIIQDKDTGRYYTQFMSDEMNQGQLREAQIDAISSAALTDLLPTLAHTPESKNEEK